MHLQVTCACGWTSTADTDALVAAVVAHSEEHHRRAAPTREEILAVATPVDGHRTPPGAAPPRDGR